MPRTDDGEFELVLGNKQLLSVFFIMAILLGVFFTMGYIMGRNSAPVAALATRDTAPSNAPRQDAPSSMPQANAAAPATTPTPSAENTRGAAPQPDAAKAPQTFGSEAPRTAGDPPPASDGAGKITQPQPGQMFVQVSSMLAQPEAEILVEVLGKKGFRAIIAPGPNEGRYRVLVGPVTDTNDAGRVKADLEQAGFKGAFPKKY
jgi:cell division septation protein DedD